MKMPESMRWRMCDTELGAQNLSRSFASSSRRSIAFAIILTKLINMAVNL